MRYPSLLGGWHGQAQKPNEGALSELVRDGTSEPPENVEPTQAVVGPFSTIGSSDWVGLSRYDFLRVRRASIEFLELVQCSFAQQSHNSSVSLAVFTSPARTP